MKRLFTMLIVLSMAFSMAWAQNDLNLTFEDDTDVANWGNYDQTNQWSTKAFDATAGVAGSGAIVFGDAGYGLLMKRPITATLGTPYSLSVDVKVEGWSAPYELYLTVDGLGSAPDSVILDTTNAGWLTYTIYGVADTATDGYIKFEGGNTLIQSYVTIDNLVFDDDVAPPVLPALFFSEYIEGSGDNKAFEIYNGTGAAVDLGDFIVLGNYNGNPWSDTLRFPVGTSLAADDVYVVAHLDADSVITAVADSLVQNPYAGGSSYMTVFNGDDVRALVYINGTDSTIIDMIGVYDLVDPGSGWSVAGIADATKDHTIIRKASVLTGNVDFAAGAGTNADDSEWMVMDQDFSESLGSHPFVPAPPALPVLFFSEYIEGSGDNKAFEIYNGTGVAVDLGEFIVLGNYNGNPWSDTLRFPVGTSLAADDVYVVAHLDADSVITAVADSLVQNPYAGGSSYMTVFNGDDVRALVYINGTDSTIIDMIGVYDLVDPGSGWSVAGIADATKDHTIIRKASVLTGNVDFAAGAGTNADDSEWMVMDQDFSESLGSHPYSAMNAVTFSVDMNFQMSQGVFVAGTDVVNVAGSFNGWGGDALADLDADGIYEGTFDIAPGDIEYKFHINGSTWESVSNRTFTVLDGGNVIPTVWFNDQEPVPTTAVEVLVQVDMSIQKLNGNFDPDAGDLIVIRGGHDVYGNWGGSVVMTLDPEQTDVYTHLGTFDNAPIGGALEYKFVILSGGDPDAAIWEAADNRSWAATGDEVDSDANGYGEILVDVAYFADVTPDDIITQDVTVTWTVDISSAYRALEAGNVLIDAQTGSDDISSWDQINGVCINGVLSQWWDWGNDLTCVGEWAMAQSDDAGLEYTYSYLYTAGQAKYQEYKYGINSLDNEAGFGENRSFEIDDANTTMVLADDCFGSQNTDSNMPFPQECGPVAISSLPGIPTSYALSQNFPNPFNPTTTISFALPEANNVVLTIYNALGQEVRTLKAGHLNAGNYSVTWDGLDNAGNTITSGIYIYRLTSGNHSFSKKMLMLK